MEQKDKNKLRTEPCCADKNVCSIDCAPKDDNSDSECECGGYC